MHVQGSGVTMGHTIPKENTLTIGWEKRTMAPCVRYFLKPNRAHAHTQIMPANSHTIYTHRKKHPYHISRKKNLATYIYLVR